MMKRFTSIMATVATTLILVTPVANAVTVPDKVIPIFDDGSEEIAAQLPPVEKYIPLRKKAKPTPYKYSMPVHKGDSFFDDNQKIAQGERGTIVGKRLLYKKDSNVTQYRFRTRDSRGYPMIATATLITPIKMKPNTNVLLYDQFINSAGNRCQIGFQISNYPQAEGAAAMTGGIVSAALAAGYPVLIPDFLGPYGAFPINRVASHINLDAIRMVSRLPKFKHSRFTLFGISGGGLAVGYTAVDQPYYAPELTKKISHIIVEDAAWDIISVSSWFGLYGPGQKLPNPFSGFISSFFVAASREYPKEMKPLYDKYLTPTGKSLFRDSRDMCLVENIANNMAIPRSATVKKEFMESKLLNTAVAIAKDSSAFYHPGHPSVPVTMIRGVFDQILPQQRQEMELAKRWQKQGAQVKQYTYPAEHMLTPVLSAPRAFALVFQSLAQR